MNTLKYLGSTLIRMLLLLFGVSIVCFFLIISSPIDPVDAYVGSESNISQEQKDVIAKYWGLNDPPVQRYITWLKNLLHGDMGKILFRQECSKGLKDGLSGFALPSVHNNLRTFLENCSVANKKGHLYVATDGLFAMILLNNLFDNNYIVLQKQEKARRLYEKE